VEQIVLRTPRDLPIKMSRKVYKIYSSIDLFDEILWSKQKGGTNNKKPERLSRSLKSHSAVSWIGNRSTEDFNISLDLRYSIFQTYLSCKTYQLAGD